MREYSGYLIFDGLDQRKLLLVGALSEEYKLHVDAGERHLEFSYSGRDTSRFVVKFLLDLAKIVGTASGEVICEVVNDDGDNEFEFYQIRSGTLVRQLGKIVRGEEQVITMQGSWPVAR